MATPQFIKNFSRNPILRAAVSLLGSIYIRFVHSTGVWRHEGYHIPQKFWAEGKPFIACFWHGRLMMMPYNWPRDIPFYMLISGHADGQLIADTIGRFGFKSLVGSTKRGGSSALRAMIKVLKDGGCIGITPDGPRGPRMRASDGAVSLAKLSGTPLVPVSFSARRRRVMTSWDRFILPLPFSSGVFLWSDPIEVSRDADDNEMEAARARLEESLNLVTNEVDRLCDQQIIEPDLAVKESPL